jgi:hypothetical protein
MTSNPESDQGFLREVSPAMLQSPTPHQHTCERLSARGVAGGTSYLEWRCFKLRRQVLLNKGLEHYSALLLFFLAFTLANF